MFIVPFRRAVAELVSAGMTRPVYGYLPDDVAHLPCIVVGRPTIGESTVPAVMLASLDVLVLGRRISDEDSQAELDLLADELFVVLGATRTTHHGTAQLHCTALGPGTTSVAGLEIPVYSASVVQEIVSC